MIDYAAKFMGILLRHASYYNIRNAKLLDVMCLGYAINDMYLDTVTKYKLYLNGSNTQKFSSDNKGNLHFDTFKCILEKELVSLDYRSKLQQNINDFPHAFIIKKLDLTDCDWVVREFEFENYLIDYNKEEIDHISSCLKGPNVFNLSDKPIDDEVIQWINKGSKYNPYVKKSFNAYELQFKQTFVNCTNRIFRRLTHKKEVIKTVETINDDLAELKVLKQQLGSMVDSILDSYNTNKKRFFNHLKTIQYMDGSNLSSDKFLEDLFNLKDDRLIIEADKQLGFTIMNKDSYINEYNKINIDQHFSKVNISEEWYIENIQSYIEKAKSSVPNQLKKIIKDKDFESDISDPAIGVLRLMPKGNSYGYFNDWNS